MNAEQIDASEVGDDFINQTFDNRRSTDVTNGLITHNGKSVNYNSHDQISTLLDDTIVRYSKKYEILVVMNIIKIYNTF